jgi:hypothetical protein
MAISSFENVRILDICADYTYQRGLDPRFVANLVTNMDLDMLGTIEVSRRDDGTLWVLDGNHRVEGLKVFLGDPNGQRIACKVWVGLTLAEEAAKFAALNAMHPPTAAAKFRAAIAAGSPEECAINDVVRSARLEISTQPSKGAVAAVTALTKVYRGGRLKKPQPEALRRTLVVMRDAWDGTIDAYQGYLIAGIGMVYVKYGDVLDDKSMVTKLATFPGGARGLIGKARGHRDSFGGDLANAVATLAVTAYNKGRRAYSIPSWGR